MYFDITMPLTFFMITMAAMFLNGKAEKKLKATFEEKEFKARDAVLFVATMSVTVTLIVFIPQTALMTMFLFVYSTTLFIFTYLFSDIQKSKAQIFFIAFLIFSFAAATVSLLNSLASNTFAYGALAFFGLFGFTLIALLHEKKRTDTKQRLYLAVLPPALFILLYTFFSGTPIWYPYLFDLYGVLFAVLIILYTGSLFTWRTMLIFVGLLTVMDAILVLVTKAMVSAATHISGLGIPVLVSLPIVPLIITQKGLLYLSLGLGDFFFGGLIAIQTMKKFGKNYAVLSAVAMSISFFIFEVLILNYEVRAFPGTLMIICGWLPLILFKSFKKREQS